MKVVGGKKSAKFKDVQLSATSDFVLRTSYFCFKIPETFAETNDS